MQMFKPLLLVFALLLTGYLSAAEDETPPILYLRDLPTTKLQTGKVYEVRGFKLTAVGGTQKPTISALLYLRFPNYGSEIRVQVEHDAFDYLRLSRNVFLLKTADGWKHLGTERLSRPGKPVTYRY